MIESNVPLLRTGYPQPGAGSIQPLTKQPL
jgi:hypothetical protein